MAQNLEKWIEIARVGRFRDSGGSWHDFSQARLEKIAAGYDPEKREAPLVFGHPATNGPAHGWIKGLKTQGAKLLALTACVSDTVREAVDNGQYKHVSMSLYQDGGLRHVGLLGAVPPAIDGLAPVAFNDDEDAITINFNEAENSETIEQQPKGSQMTTEELTKQLADLQARLNAATQERDEAVKKAASLQEELGNLKGASEKAAVEFAAYRDGHEKSELAGRIDRLVTDGKVSPAEKEAVAKTADALFQAKKAGALNFADGQENPLEVYLKSLESRKPSEVFQNFSSPAEGDQSQAATHKPLSAKL